MIYLVDEVVIMELVNRFGVGSAPRCMMVASCHEGGFVAADNSANDCFMEEFESIEDALKWLRGASLEDIWKA
jgi:hypothetical protein